MRNISYKELEEITVNELKTFPVQIPEDSFIVGLNNVGLSDSRYCSMDNEHYPMGDSYLKYGVTGVAEKAFENSRKATGNSKEFLCAIGNVYTEIAGYFNRIVDVLDEMLATSPDDRIAVMRDNMAGISCGRPKSFAQAIQLVYLMWRLRTPTCTSCIGRLDIALIEFYENDIRNGVITEELALTMLCDLWRRLNSCGSGDTLINVMVGGSNADGSDASNPLSVLMLEATLRVRLTEPHINVRFHKNMSAELKKKAIEVQLLGHGQATVYNDDVVIPALVRAGIPEEWACQYTNDGCTEIVINGGSMITFNHIDAVATLELTMNNGKFFPRPENMEGVPYCHRDHPPVVRTPQANEGYESGDVLEFESYEQLYDAFLRQYRFQVQKCCRRLVNHFENRINEVGSLVLNGTFDFVLDSGRDMMSGMPVECLQVFSGSLPTVADGLMALKKVVFEDKKYTMAEVVTALKANFEGYDAIRQTLLAAPKFGNDVDEVDYIAADITRNFCKWIEDFSNASGLLIWPSLVGWLFLQEAYSTWATPDGRRWKEPIAEHYCATPGRAKNGPTAIINSIGKTDLSKAFGVAAVHISLPKMLNLPTDQQMSIMESLVDAGIEKGLSMFNIASYDADELRAAQKDPEAHGDLIVRVWGYSARFIDLCREMQDHIISRVDSQGN